MCEREKVCEVCVGSESVITSFEQVKLDGVCVCMYVCMIIISPYRLRHWLRLNDDKRLYYPMQGSVGQLNLQLSVSKSTPHRRKHGESYFIRWRSFKGASCNIHHLHSLIVCVCVYMCVCDVVLILI